MLQLVLKYERNIKITGKKHVARYPKSMKVEIDKRVVNFIFCVSKFEKIEKWMNCEFVRDRKIIFAKWWWTQQGQHGKKLEMALIMSGFVEWVQS